MRSGPRLAARATPLLLSAFGSLGLVAVVDGALPVPAGAAPPTVTCDSDPNIFNTGYNAATGGVLANGANDANWEVTDPFPATTPATATSLPPAGTTFFPARVGRLAGGWSVSPYGNAQWISREFGSSGTGDWYYRFRFDLDPSVDPANFALSMNFLADNNVAEVFVNGVAQSSKTTGIPQNTSNPYFFVGFQIQNAAQTFLNNDWQTGANEIIVQIKSGAPFEGFLAQIRPSVLCPQPSLSLAKSANPAVVTFVGQQITYSYVVTNTGNVSLTSVAVTEAAFSGSGPAPTPSCPLPTLSPSQSQTCTATYTATQADVDAGRITNSAVATGTPPNGPAVSSAPADVLVPAVRTANVSIVKATSKPFVTTVGEQIPYTFTVTNLGTVTLSGLTVVDGKVGAPSCPATQLAAGQQTVCTATYTVTQADLDAGQVANVAGVVGTGPGGAEASAVSNQVVVPALYDPGLSIVKTTSTTTFSTLGQEIPYTFTVTNIGNVTLDGITVTDPKVGTPVCPVTQLAPAEQTVCTATYSVTQADLDAGEIVNQANALGETPNNVPIGATSNRHFITANVRPEVAIVKATPTTFYDTVDQEIPYSLTVINTGNQTLTNVVVDDPRLGGTVCTLPTLTPGQQSGCPTTTTTVTAADLDAGQISNQATAQGTSPLNDPVTATSNQVIVPAIYRPELTMVKSTTVTSFETVGAQIPYRFTVINTGNVTIDDISVTDPRIAGISCPTTILAAGEQMTCVGTYTVTPTDLATGYVINQASVSGEPPAGGPSAPSVLSNEVVVAGERPPVPAVPAPAVRAAPTFTG